MAGYVGDVRDAWRVKFISGETVMSYDTENIAQIIRDAGNGTVIYVSHEIYAWQPFGGYHVGQIISRSDVTDAFERYNRNAFFGN